MFMTFTALFIVSLGFVNVCARKMRNRHPPFMIVPLFLHLCVCVCVRVCVREKERENACVYVCFLFSAVLVFYFQPWSPL